MSDERFTANGDDPEKPYLDRKPYRPESSKPARFNLADECDKFLEAFCIRFGIARRDSKPEKKAKP